MSREVPEWVGRSDDTPLPARVKLRIVERQGGGCARCTRQFSPRLLPEFDHRLALINGGANRESNFQALCEFCHATKTKLDVARKALDAGKRKKHLGLETKRSRFPTSKNGRFKAKIGGGVEPRERS